MHAKASVLFNIKGFWNGACLYLSHHLQLESCPVKVVLHGRWFKHILRLAIHLVAQKIADRQSISLHNARQLTISTWSGKPDGIGLDHIPWYLQKIHPKRAQSSSVCQQQMICFEPLCRS